MLFVAMPRAGVEAALTRLAVELHALANDHDEHEAMRDAGDLPYVAAMMGQAQPEERKARLCRGHPRLLQTHLDGSHVGVGTPRRLTARCAVLR